MADALVPRLTGSLTATAPGVCLRMLGEAVTTVDALRRGTVDLQTSDEAPQYPDTRTAAALTASLTVAVRPLDLGGLHRSAARGGVPARSHPRPPERSDGRHIIYKNVTFTVPTLVLAMCAVAADDLITVAPALLGADALPAGLHIYPLPEPTTGRPFTGHGLIRTR
ncbi:hypothetical protein [Streptomyces hesseae]|uniref:LysR substrate-binding domain-containing protein n=1 Tax=Streptomyces hesseae TaxID=3075519 RepID=A0ABU2SK21_9ACTN|nr:hypothetical protein [Streptomyces sp. DSM 40473]MDT0449245.1 hypothetical protein [Streptomyces sp. DSM 40473]